MGWASTNRVQLVNRKVGYCKNEMFCRRHMAGLSSGGRCSSC